MHVRDLEMEDYFNFPNAAADGQPGFPGGGLGELDATVSFDVVWGGPVTRRITHRDPANSFAGTYAENQATVTWSGSNEDGFSFVANPGNFATSASSGGLIDGNFPFAEIGHERNGIFFQAGSSVAAPAGSKANSLADQAFALLAFQSSNPALNAASTDLAAVTTAVGPRDSASSPDAGASRSLLSHAKTPGEAARIVRVARDRVFEFGSDPAATAFVTKIGHGGDDTFFA